MLAFSRTSLCVFFSPKTNKTSHARKLGSRLQSVSLLAVLILSLAGWLSASPGPSGQWTLTAAMSQARTGAAAAVMSNGKVLVAGGGNASGAASATAEIYGPSGTFTAVAPMNRARTGHTATWLPAGSGGYVLVTGGTTTGGTVLDSAELYDPAANRWTLLPAPTSTAAVATPLPDSALL